MTIKIEHLDYRFKGFPRFSHRAEIGRSPSRESEFIDIREWCWNTYGPSCERNIVRHRPDVKWSWHIDDFKDGYFIYLAGTDELTHFTLKWS